MRGVEDVRRQAGRQGCRRPFVWIWRVRWARWRSIEKAFAACPIREVDVVDVEEFVVSLCRVVFTRRGATAKTWR